jgi:hypothetical protein
VADEVVDLADQVAHRAERVASDRLVAEMTEEAQGQVEPRSVGRDEVEVPARPGRAAPSRDDANHGARTCGLKY